MNELTNSIRNQQKNKVITIQTKNPNKIINLQNNQITENLINNNNNNNKLNNVDREILIQGKNKQNLDEDIDSFFQEALENKTKNSKFFV